VPESESQDGYLFGMTGVICHEFGHQLGLPDLYDTTPEENGNGQGLGSWDIMSTGVWNANGFVPSGPSAWSRVFLGRTGNGAVAPSRVTRDAPVSISQVGGKRAPRRGRSRSHQSERYFLIENRNRSGGDGRFTFDDSNGNRRFDFYTDSYAGAEFDSSSPTRGAVRDLDLPCG
jgi:M6 family metalloprotease-like protein